MAIIHNGNESASLSGTSGADTIFAGSGYDTITGRAGNDELRGEGDNDQISGDSGRDRIWGGLGNDTLSGGNGIDVLTGDLGDDVLDLGQSAQSGDVADGGSGQDLALLDYSSRTAAIQLSFLANPGQSSLLVDGVKLIAIEHMDVTGTKYADHLDSGSSGDTLHGGAGNDSLSGNGGADSIFGEAGNNLLSGDDGNDTVVGEDGDDTIAGGSGSDNLFGGTGKDEISGGDGNDSVLFVAGETGKADGGSGTGDWLGWQVLGDTPFLFRAAAPDQTGSFNGMTYTGFERFYIAGSSGNDTIVGGNATDWLVGGQGADIIYGGGGNDTLSGGDSKGKIDGGNGRDDISSWAAGDILNGGAGDDVVHIHRSSSSLGIVITDTSETSIAQDGTRITGCETFDIHAFSAGLIEIHNTGNDTIFTGDENNRISTGGGNDSVFASGGNDKLFGGAGNDTLDGGDLHDVLNGGIGDDVLSCQSDLFFADTFNGGAGNDIAIVNDYDDHNDLFLRVGPGTVKINQGSVLIDIEAIRFYCSDHNNRIIGGNLADGLYGSLGNDTLSGRAGNDTITSGGGTDILNGDGGDDIISSSSESGPKLTLTMNGGLGNDSITGAYGIDVIDGGGGDDTVSSGARDPLGRSISDGMADTVNGGDGDDRVAIFSDGDSATGGLGNDTVVLQYSANKGSYSFNLSDGTIHYGQSTFTGFEAIDYEGSPNADTVSGGSGSDAFRDTAGKDVYHGKGGDDILIVANEQDSSGTADTFDGGGGVDTVIFQNQFVRAEIDLAAPATNGGVAALDTFVSIERFDLTGYGDAFKGDDQANTVNGDYGGDELDGRGGDDVLAGEDMADVLTGGAGADQFLYANSGEGGDVITDFERGTDRIVISQPGFNELALTSIVVRAGENPAAKGAGPQFLFDTDDHQLWYDNDGGREGEAVLIATLNGITELTAADFILEKDNPGIVL